MAAKNRLVVKAVKRPFGSQAVDTQSTKGDSMKKERLSPNSARTKTARESAVARSRRVTPKANERIAMGPKLPKRPPIAAARNDLEGTGLATSVGGFGLPGLRQRVLEEGMGKGIDRWLQPLCAVDERRHPGSAITHRRILFRRAGSPETSS